MQPTDRVFVAGHRGMVGSAIVRRLENAGFSDVVVAGRDVADLTDHVAVDRLLAEMQPNVVVLAAAKVGGILANDSYPADFIRDNLQIQTNVIDGAWRHGAKKLLFLGSSCIYPREADQPIHEDSLLTGPLEPTNQWYAIAKIAGIKMCQAYRRQYGFDAICVQPTNVYGPGDNYDLASSHVVAALIRKFHEAKINGDADVTVWGTGSPRREFIHVDDLANACTFLLDGYSGEDNVNIGTGQEVTIAEFAAIVSQVVGFEGGIVYDTSKPDGTPRKLIDSSRLAGLGWAAGIGLEDGLGQAYQWFLDNVAGKA
ncbi:MAG: GDP-L-fucose synthase [Alphaproteobacteria bacterium]|nr:GDP-L-fucose synthase [Rhodospirillaceae bacterium]MDG2481542.1 GDP-L-fucose synthase [Alphaproteobacteria bacterium]MBT6202309.1 GDP-L-fucose synthase [Rhodospirillaceae bacterium]MBT6512592.1 GDP-L-fucose synthase [Rhodospirillaceae bacterium]MBT7614902.1 GDP-L-fucose synthase [Rhodospirillaceae bacterium]